LALSAVWRYLCGVERAAANRHVIPHWAGAGGRVRRAGGARVVQRSNRPADEEWFDAEARAEWQRVVPGLERLDLLKPEDRAMLVVFCTTWSRYVDAVARLRADGFDDDQPGLWPHKRPSLRADRQHRGRPMRAFAAEFGLSPVAERRLGSITPPDDDEHSAFTGG
jgi:P27 family predicted phage terminase small subunit